MESKDLEYTIMLMETFITDIGKMIWKMVMESWLTQVDLSIKGNGKRERKMEEESIIMKMGWYLKVALHSEENMGMVFLSSQLGQK